MTTWNVELHSHSLYSMDCRTALRRILDMCDSRGVDKIAITDHNETAGAIALQRLAPDRVIVGEEIMTTQGEILAFFVTEKVPAKLSPEETIKRLRDQGAVISVSHPYDRLRKGAWEEDDLLKIIDQVDALETFNSRCIYHEDNLKAQQLAEKYNLPGTVGSDAHVPYEYGRATMRMQPFQTPTEFLQSLRAATPVTQFSPVWVHGMSKVAKYLNRAERRLGHGVHAKS
jgi:predicted metal-dependent phosphoesterase TrpH